MPAVCWHFHECNMVGFKTHVQLKKQFYEYYYINHQRNKNDVILLHIGRKFISSINIVHP